MPFFSVIVFWKSAKMTACDNYHGGPLAEPNMNQRQLFAPPRGLASITMIAASFILEDSSSKESQQRYGRKTNLVANRFQ